MIRDFSLVLLVALGACSSNESTPRRTEAERDSVIAQSKVPGAAGVRGARAAGDSARARAAGAESVNTEP